MSNKKQAFLDENSELVIGKWSYTFLGRVRISDGKGKKYLQYKKLAEKVCGEATIYDKNGEFPADPNARLVTVWVRMAKSKSVEKKRAQILPFRKKQAKLTRRQLCAGQ